MSEKTLSVLKRVMRYLIPFFFIPLLIALGAVVFDQKRYLIISLGVAVLSLLLFYTAVEKKNIGARRMVAVAVMTALSVLGRFIPILKPVTAITILAAIYLGAEAGFLVGSLSALLSNIYFGQGPWTPFQMLAWGLLGLLSGYLAVFLKKSRWRLLLWGVITGVLYSLVMDVWTVLWYNGSFDVKLYLTACLTALPFTALYAVANVIFLWFLSKPFGEKLERVKIKYGI